MCVAWQPIGQSGSAARQALVEDETFDAIEAVTDHLADCPLLMIFGERNDPFGCQDRFPHSVP